jgi:hypothetical protein
MLDRVPLRWWFIGTVGVLLAASAAFGGLADARPVDHGPVTVEPGEEFVGPELATIVHSAEFSDTAPGRFEPDEGYTYLVVRATVTNLWTVSSITFNDVLQTPWLGEDLAEAERVVFPDGTLDTQVNPQVPLDVIFMWDVPLELVPEDGIVPVTIMSKSFTKDGDVTYGSYWSDPQPAAIVTLEAER